MKNYTFTKPELEYYSEIVVSLSHYINTYDSPEEYTDWLDATFGEDWHEYNMDFDLNIYEYEFDYDFYYCLVTGRWSDEIKEWVKDRKKYINECLAEQE